MAEKFPVTNEEIIGKWQGYVLNHGEITFMSPVLYHFLPSGTWSIQDGEHDAVPQGWYKLDRNAIFLQPLQAARKNENAAVKAHWKNRNAFEVPNPIDKNHAMIFIRKKSVRKMCIKDIIGTWRLEQHSLYTGKTKKAPFLLQIKSNGTYNLVAEDAASLSEEWSIGTYEISGEKLHLKNKYTGPGLWNKPSFFLLDGKLRYNNIQYCLWCERVHEEK